MTAQHSTQRQSYRSSIIETMLEMHKETVFSKFNLNIEKMEETVDYMIKYGFVYFDGECLFMGRIHTTWYSDQPMASDFILYTRKSSRGKGLAKKAIGEFIGWAKDNGAIAINIAQSSGVACNEFKSLAESLNLKKIGEVYNV